MPHLPFDDRRGAVFYVAKYITKQGGDWDMSENLGRLQTQPILPLLGGKTGGNHLLPVTRDSRKHPRATRELQKRTFVPEVLSRPSPSVMDVYRSEVTRFGKGRFREF